MNEYNGCLCQLCSEKFAEGDDIVVCPDCGTPMHRSCWNESRCCPNENWHSSGFEWKKGTAEKTVAAETDGADLDGEDTDGETPEVMTMNELIEKIIAQREAQQGEPVMCDGISQKELMYFFGKSNFFTPNYISYCVRPPMTGRKLSTHLFAAFFIAPSFFYRRMNLFAIPLTLLSAVLSMPQLVQYIGAYIPELREAAARLLSTNPFPTISSVFTLIMIGLTIAALLFSDYFYVRWSYRRIKEIREKFDGNMSEEYFLALEDAGNPRFGGFIVGMLANSVLSSVIIWMIYIMLTGSAA